MDEIFGTFYYPKVTKREEATVLNIGLGDIVELEVYPPIARETITVEGVMFYSDGKPVADQFVYFQSSKKQSAGNDEDEDENDDRAKTDLQGRFSIKIVKGAKGFLIGEMYTYEGEFENCPKLDRLIKQARSGGQEITTSPVEIRATTNLYGVELKYQFPSCKKAKSQ